MNTFKIEITLDHQGPRLINTHRLLYLPCPPYFSLLSSWPSNSSYNSGLCSLFLWNNRTMRLLTVCFLSSDVILCSDCWRTELYFVLPDLPVKPRRVFTIEVISRTKPCKVNIRTRGWRNEELPQGRSSPQICRRGWRNEELPKGRSSPQICRRGWRNEKPSKELKSPQICRKKWRTSLIGFLQCLTLDLRNGYVIQEAVSKDGLLTKG